MYMARISGRTPHSTTSVRSFDGDAGFTVPPLRGTRKHALAELNSVMRQAGLGGLESSERFQL